MRLNNLKKTVMVSAFGLTALFGLSDVANAQSRRSIEQQERKIRKEQRKLERKIDRYEDKQEARADRWRVYRDGRYYETDYRGAELLRQAVNQGYQQGFRAGQYDRMNRRRGNYYGSSIYQSGNYGYQRYVDSAQYRYYFQQGFERGYQDGYNSSYRYGTYRNGVANILGSVLQTILNIRQY
jgi:flagellar biosynthesis/type III secretory pathway protein FliH